MAPRKLSDTDKQEISKLYCQPGETTSTLADKFGVSNSTVSRVLKQQFSDEDYAQLMQWKRSGERGPLELTSDFLSGEAAETDAEALSPSAAPDAAEATEAATVEDPDNGDDQDLDEEETEPIRRSRRRLRSQSAATAPNDDQLPLQFAEEGAVEAAVPEVTEAAAEEPLENFVDADDDTSEAETADWEDDEDLDAADDYDDDEFEDDDNDDEDWDEEPEARATPLTTRQERLEILPFDQLSLQKPCYLVVDRLSELITCPLKEFAELGLIPEAEEQARTLPVFDNHRIARRFARRNQRIVKIPSGIMLNKTQPYLQAKGITRLLFDGQVYALTSVTASS